MIKKRTVKIFFISFVQSFKNGPKFMPLDKNSPLIEIFPARIINASKR